MDTGSMFEKALAPVKERLKEAVFRRARAKFHVPDDAVRNLRSFSRLSGSAASGFPTELLSLGASMWSGFIFTPFARQQMEGWVLPFWLWRQSRPWSGSFVPHGHAWVHANVTHRNWTGIGLPGFPNEATVDPRGLVTMWPFAPSVDLWVLSNGRLVCPSEIDVVEQELIEDMPMVRTEFVAGGLKCSWSTFVSRLDGTPVILSLAGLSNPGTGGASASLVVSVRPYNNESIRAINRLAFLPGDRVFTADGNVLCYLPEPPDRVFLSDYIHGDVAQQLKDPERERLPAGTLEVEEPVGLATGAAVYDREISPGGEVSICFSCPLSPGVRPSFQRMLPRKDANGKVSLVLREQRDEWKEAVSAGAGLSFPDDRYERAFRANKAFLLLLYDGKSITPGVSTYHMMWFRDAAYLVPALDRIGHHEKARVILLAYQDRQMDDGFFRSHSGEWDSNGQAIWALVEHYRYTADIQYLREVYPSIIKGARWIDSMLQRDLPGDDPGRGLMPEGISAEHFGISDCYYWDDFWSVAGLRAASEAASVLGKDDDVRYLGKVEDYLWKSLRASWATVRRRLGRDVMPTSPSRDIDSGCIGNVAAVYPLGLMPPGEPMLENTVREMVDRCFYRDTLYHGIMHCGLNPYMSMQVAQYFLRLRDPYALKIFESLWSMATGTLTFPEAINPLTGGGAYGDGHHGWSVCDIFNFVRNLMLLEEGDRLTLLAVGRRQWFEKGNTIELSNAPTHFGDFSYRVICGDGELTFELPGGLARPPSNIQVNVPFPVTFCEVDGARMETAEGAGSVEVPPTAGRVVLGIER